MTSRGTFQPEIFDDTVRCFVFWNANWSSLFPSAVLFFFIVR